MINLDAESTPYSEIRSAIIFKWLITQSVIKIRTSLITKPLNKGYTDTIDPQNNNDILILFWCLKKNVLE